MSFVRRCGNVLPATIAGAAFSAAAAAAPVAYRESVDGDLEAFGGQPAFVLDVGLNTIGGTLGYDAVGTADYDNFVFTVPVGTTLTAASLLLADAAGNGGDLAYADFFLHTGSTVRGGAFVEYLHAFSPATYTFGSIPLGAGDYVFYNSTFGYQGPFPAQADYTFSFTLEALPQAIPEPASLALIGLALVGLAVARGRRGARAG